MKRLILLVLYTTLCLVTKAQVPNFGQTSGRHNLYGYNAIKYRMNSNSWETYNTLQYGISDYISVGGDLYNDGFNSYVGYTVRAGTKLNNWFSIGSQITPSFNICDRHNFSYMTYALYLNGSVTADGKLFWVTDTWLEQNQTNLSTANQWTYLGYSFMLPGMNNSITPMAGTIHSWKFDRDVDLSFGAYFTHNNINLYMWVNDILTKNPRVCLAVEFKFGNGVN